VRSGMCVRLTCRSRRLALSRSMVASRSVTPSSSCALRCRRRLACAAAGRGAQGEVLDAAADANRQAQQEQRAAIAVPHTLTNHSTHSLITNQH
jgi:hypothetical protein